MKKLLLIPLLSLTLSADTIEERNDVCSKLENVSPSLLKVLEDSYSIESGKDFQCRQINNVQESFQKIVQTDIYAVVAGNYFSFGMPSRTQKACHNFSYELFVDKAIKHVANSNTHLTIESLQEISIKAYEENPIKDLAICHAEIIENVIKVQNQTEKVNEVREDGDSFIKRFFN